MLSDILSFALFLNLTLGKLSGVACESSTAPSSNSSSSWLCFLHKCKKAMMTEAMNEKPMHPIVIAKMLLVLSLCFVVTATFQGKKKKKSGTK